MTLIEQIADVIRTARNSGDMSDEQIAQAIRDALKLEEKPAKADAPKAEAKPEAPKPAAAAAHPAPHQAPRK